MDELSIENVRINGKPIEYWQGYTGQELVEKVTYEGERGKILEYEYHNGNPANIRVCLDLGLFPDPEYKPTLIERIFHRG